MQTYQHHCYYNIESLTDDLDRDVISVAIPFELLPKSAYFCTPIGFTPFRRGNKWRKWLGVYVMRRSISFEQMTILSNCLSKIQFLTRLDLYTYVLDKNTAKILSEGLK